MINTILQKIRQYSKAVLATIMLGSGAAALYLCTSTFLAAILLAMYLNYAWDIDKGRWQRAFAVLRGIEYDEAQAEVRKRIIDEGYNSMIAERAKRVLSDEYQEVRQQVVGLPLPELEEPPPPPPPAPNDAERISDYEKRVQADLAKARQEGLDEVTRFLENTDPDQAKEVLRKFWKDGKNRQVITVLLDMADKRRDEIFRAMQQDNAEELKDLCEILQRIADGEPKSSILNEAAKEP